MSEIMCQLSLQKFTEFSAVTSQNIEHDDVGRSQWKIFRCVQCLLWARTVWDQPHMSTISSILMVRLLMRLSVCLPTCLAVDAGVSGGARALVHVVSRAAGRSLVRTRTTLTRVGVARRGV